MNRKMAWATAAASVLLTGCMATTSETPDRGAPEPVYETVEADEMAVERTRVDRQTRGPRRVEDSGEAVSAPGYDPVCLDPTGEDLCGD